MVFFTYFGIHFENDLVYKDNVYTVHTMSCTHVVYGADNVMHKLCNVHTIYVMYKLH